MAISAQLILKVFLQLFYIQSLMDIQGIIEFRPYIQDEGHEDSNQSFFFAFFVCFVVKQL
jgi:hypothetical protein